MGNFELKCVKICSGLNFSFEAQHSVHLVSQQKLFSPGRMSHDVIVTGFFFFFYVLGNIRLSQHNAGVHQSQKEGGWLSEAEKSARKSIL